MFAYICLVIILIALFVIFLVFLDTQDKNRIIDKVKNFESYVIILEYHMKKAYDIIYKDKILIYSLEAVKINDVEFNVVSKEFALLVMKFIGENLKNEFIELYGNEETFILNLIEYFNNKFENDEIRERAKENILNDSSED
jgi:hypothetical protein